MKHYEFSLLLNGYGETSDEAWEEAIEGFTMDPGCLTDDEITFIEELDEDGNEFENRKVLKDEARVSHPFSSEELITIFEIALRGLADGTIFDQMAEGLDISDEKMKDLQDSLEKFMAER